MFRNQNILYFKHYVICITKTLYIFLNWLLIIELQDSLISGSKPFCTTHLIYCLAKLNKITKYVYTNHPIKEYVNFTYFFGLSDIVRCLESVLYL